MISKVIIKPLIGIDSIHLGMQRNVVETVLGVPDLFEQKAYDEDDSTEVILEYTSFGIELTFSSTDNYLLGTITIKSEEAELNGHKIIGLRENEFLNLLSHINIGPIKLEDDFIDLDSRDYTCDSLSMSFWVHNGILTSITLYPKYDDTGNTPIWPNIIR